MHLTSECPLCGASTDKLDCPCIGGSDRVLWFIMYLEDGTDVHHVSNADLQVFDHFVDSSKEKVCKRLYNYDGGVSLGSYRYHLFYATVDNPLWDSFCNAGGYGGGSQPGYPVNMRWSMLTASGLSIPDELSLVGVLTPTQIKQVLDDWVVD